MQRPFADKRPLGPFATSNTNSFVSVRDLRDKSKADYYDPIGWANCIPDYLFHNTNIEGVDGIVTDKEFSTSGNALNNIFVSATVEEKFGDFTFVFDGLTCVEERGFSPRTYLIDEKEKYKESDMQEYYKTNRGVVWDERLVGCYPKPLYSSFDYPNTESRCNPNLSIPFDVYASQPSVFGLEPSGEIEVNENPKINLVGLMQQSFVRDIASGPMDIHSMGVTHIMYVNRKQEKWSSHNQKFAELAASKLEIEAITNREALDEFPQLTAGKPIYDTEYITSM
jgi:hypothetical protein